MTWIIVVQNQIEQRPKNNREKISKNCFQFKIEIYNSELGVLYAKL